MQTPDIHSPFTSILSLPRPTKKNPQALLPPFTHRAPEFGDGAILARLVAGLMPNEETAGEEEVEEEAAALGGAVVSRLRRIQRALGALRRLREARRLATTIPLHLLHREIDVLEGRTDALVPLLLTVKRAYEEGEEEASVAGHA